MSGRVSREVRQERALVMFLETLPAERLERILEDLGVPAQKREEAASRRDRRRCDVCGNGYKRCREIWENDHPWTPVLPASARATEGERIAECSKVLELEPHAAHTEASWSGAYVTCPGLEDRP